MATVDEGSDSLAVISKMTIWRRANPEKARATRRAYEKKNRKSLNRKRKLWRKNNPDKIRDQWLNQQYGIGTAWYAMKLAAQSHCCAICKQSASLFKRNLAVDHNHTTNKNRGLLCIGCNVLIGQIERAKVTWAQLNGYLKEYEESGC